eukprot:ctg_899.g359
MARVARPRERQPTSRARRRRFGRPAEREIECRRCFGAREADPQGRSVGREKEERGELLRGCGRRGSDVGRRGVSCVEVFTVMASGDHGPSTRLQVAPAAPRQFTPHSPHATHRPERKSGAGEERLVKMVYPQVELAALYSDFVASCVTYFKGSLLQYESRFRAILEIWGTASATMRRSIAPFAERLCEEALVDATCPSGAHTACAIGVSAGGGGRRGA